MWALLLLLGLYALSKAQAQPQAGTQIVTGIPTAASGAKMPMPQEAIDQAVAHALQNLFGTPIPQQGAGPLTSAVPAGSAAATGSGASGSTAVSTSSGTGSGVTTTTGTTQTGTAPTGGYTGGGSRSLLII